jgi:hypothetical protein
MVKEPQVRDVREDRGKGARGTEGRYPRMIFQEKLK